MKESYDRDLFILKLDSITQAINYIRKSEDKLIFREIYFMHYENLIISQIEQIESVDTGIVRIKGKEPDQFTYLINEPIIKLSLEILLFQIKFTQKLNK